MFSWQFIKQKTNSILTAIFIISIYLNSVEVENPFVQDSRFAIKPTMISLTLLFLIVVNNKDFFRFKNSFFLLLAWFALAQYLSLFGSEHRYITLQQSLVVTLLMAMTWIVSKSLQTLKQFEEVFLIVAYFGIVFCIFQLINYYTLIGYYGRLGGDSGNLRGGPLYIGELLVMLSPFVFLLLNSVKYLYKVFGILILTTCISMTLAKGVIISFIIFCLVTMLNKQIRLISVISLLLIIVTSIFSYLGIFDIPKQYLDEKEYSIFLDLRKYNLLQSFGKDIGEITSEMKTVLLNDSTSKASIVHRIKAALVAIKNSANKPVWGHGAGTSQILMPSLAERFDEDASSEILELLIKYHAFGQNQTCCIDAHNTFLVQLFETGLVGFIPLVVMFLWQIRKHLSLKSDSVINVLILASLISIIVHRMSINWTTIPNLWFVLGLSQAYILNCEKKVCI